ncbi:response regulator [Terriglobus aquaticus]|uniref:Response regulator n=1 Tax=Terriglobus aquaticus TaxID=940139 RepID=A0ABW9KFS6_9BACT|nr:response regulator [Terriglobus aquaticus]
MSEEQNVSEAPTAVAPPPSAATQFEEGDGSTSGSNSGTGVSKSRRRRRKRKNRTAQGAGANAGQPGEAQAGSIEASSEGAAEGSTPVAAAPQQQRQQGGNGSGNGGQQQGQGEGGGRRKKKKKFRRAGEGGGNGQPRPEPGNSLQGSHSGQNGMRRNRKQQQGRGPRSFVGPMDHSYREVNGNYADAPASTINVNGNNGGHRRQGHGRAFNEDRLPPELMHHYKPIAIPEDAPTHIYFFIEDLFFTAKIQEVAKQQGVKVAFMKPDKDVVAHLAELHDHEHPSLIVFDLNNAAAKPLTLIPKLKAKLKKGTSILGFLSHLQGDLKQKAVEAGCHTVMPRSAFSQNLPNLLRRYGVDDADEPNFNM